jgi:hypothetical protein
VFKDQDQKQIKSFPAAADPTEHRVLLVGPALAGKALVGTPRIDGD